MEDRVFTLELLGTNELEVAYLAGLFDGEGYISVSTKTHRPAMSKGLIVGVQMTTPEPLHLCSRIFGGKVRSRWHRPNEKLLYGWTLQGKRCETFLRFLFSYLLVKKEKANLALSFLACGRGLSSKKRELAELITPHRTKSHDVNPD